MPTNLQSNRYTRSQRWLHWLITLLLVLMVILGLSAARQPFQSEAKFLLQSWHQVTGLLVLGLAIWRIILRRRYGRPKWPAPIPAWQSYLVNTVHCLFYGLLVLIPLLGISLSITDPYVFPEFTNQPAAGKAAADWADLLHQCHYYAVWLLGVLLLAHLIGALWHWCGKDRRLWIRRMV